MAVTTSMGQVLIDSKDERQIESILLGNGQMPMAYSTETLGTICEGMYVLYDEGRPVKWRPPVKGKGKGLSGQQWNIFERGMAKRHARVAGGSGDDFSVSEFRLAVQVLPSHIIDGSLTKTLLMQEMKGGDQVQWVQTDGSVVQSAVARGGVEEEGVHMKFTSSVMGSGGNIVSRATDGVVEWDVLLDGLTDIRREDCTRALVHIKKSMTNETTRYLAGKGPRNAKRKRDEVRELQEMEGFDFCFEGIDEFTKEFRIMEVMRKIARAMPELCSAIKSPQNKAEMIRLFSLGE